MTTDPALDPSWPPDGWYEEVGFKCGLEVHQQLKTDRKLFCRCPAGLYVTTHDSTILRHMRPTLSELGGYDGTALMEFRTRKRILYLLDRRVVCTYEMDDTPPMLVDQTAIDTAIEQCLMLGCDIVDEVHIARKQYLDGSIPTGFQRTAVVGVNGKLPFRGRTLSIIQVTVEEDSCREVSDAGHLIVWRADRLGMPLIETVTEPELLHPDEVDEAILLVGRVCRNTGHVRTGIGASRQDVNVSVRGGTRVEIKGVPKAGWAPALVRGEAIRQVRLLELKDELHARGITAETVRVEGTDVTDKLPGAEEAWRAWVDARGYREGLEIGEGAFTVVAVTLGGCAGLLAHPTQPGRTFADELRGRLRVVAGIDRPPIVDVDSERLARMRVELGVADGDALVLIEGPSEDTRTGTEEIRQRLVQATEGIPAETRQPFEDGSTDFERILPGPDRMYPDTDSPPTRVTRERVEALRDALPAPPWEREARYASAGLPEDACRWLIRRGAASLVDAAAPEGCDAGRLRRAAFLFGERFKGWGRRHDVAAVPAETWVALFEATERRPALRDGLTRIVGALCQGASLDEALPANGETSETSDWAEALRREVAEAVGERAGLEASARRRHHVGRALGALRGRVPGAQVAAAVDEALGVTS